MPDFSAEAWKVELEAYRQSLVQEKTLPKSGLKFYMKQVGLLDLVLQGGIPDSLSGLVGRVMEQEGEVKAKDVFSGTEDLEVVSTMFNLVIKACTVHPPLADTGDETHLGINEIPFEDREWIFNWANGDAEALKPFRGDTEGTST